MTESSTGDGMVNATSKHAVAAIAAGPHLELTAAGGCATEIAPELIQTGIFRAINDKKVRTSYVTIDVVLLQPDDIAAAIPTAVTIRPKVGAGLIELRPFRQP